ncbi:hypothetical protein SAMN02745176_00909 [Lutispora thermophila DSM 19022]|uniref:Uncharacterized protein n=1 Tax=Lutispora thermophila DSM 19022 TaxID=1122184 RepID=A0A1M6CS22_9FIRM|nr:hypothetical protein SAMN02745176_00909 [Lutispora thermophila DSM 19022]
MNKVNIKLNKMFIECKYPKNLLFNDMSKLISIQRNTMDIFNAYDYDKNVDLCQYFRHKNSDLLC